MLKKFKGLWGYNWCGPSMRFAKEGEDGGGGGETPIAGLFDEKGVLVDNFQDRLPEDAKKDQKLIILLTKFKGKSAPDILKSHVELERKIGGMVQIPSEGATEEDIRKFQLRLGAQEKPEGYILNVPEGVKLDENRTKEAQVYAHKMGWSTKTFQQVFDLYCKFCNDDITEYNAEQVKVKAEQEKAKNERLEKLATARRLLEARWGTGENFDRQAAFAQRAAEDGISKEFSEALIEAGLNDDPRVLAGLHKLGKKLGVKSIVFGKQGAEPSAQERLKSRYKNSPELTGG